MKTGYEKIHLRRGSADLWSRVNPTLRDGELGVDKTHKRLKCGDDKSQWLDLPYLYHDLYDQLAASLQVITGVVGGKILDPVELASELNAKNPGAKLGDFCFAYDRKKFFVRTAGAESGWLELTPDWISATRMRELVKQEMRDTGTLGMGYTIEIDDATGQSKKITYDDGLVGNITRDAAHDFRVQRIDFSNGSQIIFNYNTDGALIERKVTRGA